MQKSGRTKWKEKRKKSYDRKEMKKMFAMFEKYQKQKKNKKRRRSNDSSDSDSSDSDWIETSLESEDDRDSKELFARDEIGNTFFGSGPNDHLFKPTRNNKLSNDSISTKILLNSQHDVEYLRNNLYVYNESSYPTRLRKQIREKLEFSPEVVAILLPDGEKMHT